MPPPALANESLSTSPRYKVVLSLAGDLDVYATYGSLTREIVCLGSGQLDTVPSSPVDPASPNESIPQITPGMGFGISAAKVLATTTCFPLLLLF